MKVTAIQTKAYRMKDMLLDVINEDEVITCKEIARRLGLKFNDIKFVVIKLVEWDLLCEKRGGKYLFYHKPKKHYLQELYHPMPNFKILSVYRHTADQDKHSVRNPYRGIQSFNASILGIQHDPY
jgi:hypothetical protein